MLQLKLDQARQTGDAATEATLLLQLGDLARDELEYEIAQGLYAQAWDVYEKLRDLRGQAQALTCLAPIHYFLSRRDLAQMYFEQAVALCEQVGDLEGAADILHKLADLQHGHPPDYAAQSGYYKRAIAHYETLNQPLKSADVISRLGQNAATERNYVLAAQYYAQEVALREQHGGDPGRHYAAQEHLGYVLLPLGSFALAREAYLRALSLAHPGYPIQKQHCLMQLAFISVVLSKIDEGRAYAQQAFVIDERKTDPIYLRERIENRRMWARLVHHTNPEEARQMLTMALAFAQEHPDQEYYIDTLQRDFAALDSDDPEAIKRFRSGS